MDLALLGLTAGLRGTRKRRVAALLAVAAVMALDIYATRRASMHHRKLARFRRRNRIPTLAAASPH